jgi:phospholipid/cholesterol/gamma-HCH transport system permease protein
MNGELTLGRVAWQTLRRTLGGRREPGVVVHQLYEIGNRSVVFVAVTLGFIGMVLVYQSCLQLGHITGDLSQVGSEFTKILVHEFAPSITALMLATRVGAGIAAEIGSMVVTEQVDALRMNGIEPVEYLIVPRFIACLVMVATLTAVAAAVSLGMGTVTAYMNFDVNPRIFVDFSRVTVGDVFVGLTKSIAYGAAIPIISGWCGLRAHGGSQGVGTATTRAVIGSSLAIIMLDFLLSGLGYLLIQKSAGAP